MKTVRALSAAVVSALFMALAACGGGDGDPAPQPQTSVTKTIGAAGGVIQGPGGVVLTVPPDALAADVDLTIALDDAGAPPLSADFGAASPTLALLPHGTRFSVPVTLSLPVDAAALAGGDPLRVLKTNDARDGWQSLVVELSGDTATVATTSFSNAVAVIYLPPAVTVLGQPRDCTVVDGGWCFFRVDAVGRGPLTYQWFRNGVPISGETDELLLLNPVALRDNGAVFSARVGVQGLSVQITTTAARLTVLATPPTIVTQPLDTQVVAGTNAVFSAASTSGIAQSLQWKRCNPSQACPSDRASWTNVPGGNSTTLVVGGTTLADDGSRFAMCASNTEGTVCSRDATLSVTPREAQPAILDQPQDVSSVAGRSAYFQVLATGGGLTYTWQRSDAGGPFVTLPGASGASYTISNLVAADDGARLRVIVANSLATLVSQPAALNVIPSAGVALMRVAGGLGHSLALRADGRLLGFGDNRYGNLGDGTAGGTVAPAALNLVPDVATFSAGPLHSLGVGSDGTVWAWGFGGNNRLGLGGTANQPTPAMVPGLPPSRGVAAGRSHSLAVAAASGSLYGWGTNNCGELGDGTVTGRTAPVLALLNPVVGVVASYGRSHALRSNGTVFSWGCNADGQLGTGDLQAAVTPVPVTGVAQAVALAAGAVHTLALTVDGRVFAWGRNEEGQLGDGSTQRRLAPVEVLLPGIAVAVAAGDAHSMALLSDGRVYAWGGNDNGQVGIGTNLNVLAPVRVGAPLPADIVSIGSGGVHALAMAADGSLWAWGGNAFTQLGDGTVQPRSLPQQVPGINLN